MQNLILNYNHHMAMWHTWGDPGSLAAAERILSQVRTLSNSAQEFFHRHTPVFVGHLNDCLH